MHDAHCIATRQSKTDRLRSKEKRDADWRVTIDPSCRELLFAFPRKADAGTLPSEIIIKTNSDRTETPLTRAKGDELEFCLSESEIKISDPPRSDSPEILPGDPVSESTWLTERASVALNDLLSSLKIDPKILSPSMEDETEFDEKRAMRKSDDGRSLRNWSFVRSSNEGKLSVQSHPLSTCSV